MNIEEKREQWEKGSNVLTVIENVQLYPKENIAMGHVLVVLEDKHNPDYYMCHRYFPMMTNDNWEVSVDGQSVSLSTVWKWLQEPSARTCRDAEEAIEEEEMEEEEMEEVYEDW